MTVLNVVALLLAGFSAGMSITNLVYAWMNWTLTKEREDGNNDADSGCGCGDG